MGAPGFSWRRLAWLIEQLPADSATARSIHGEEETMWGIAEYLLAAAVDALQAANWQRAGDKNLVRPKPVPRPGVRDPRDERRSRLTPEQMRARLREQLQRHQRRALTNGS